MLGHGTARRARMATIATLAAATMVLVGCSAGGGTEGDGADGITADDPYALPESFTDTIIIEVGQSLNNPGARPYIALGDKIEELSNGQITVEFSSGYALHPPNEVTSAVRDGVAKIAFVMPGIEPAGYETFTWYGKALASAIDESRPVLGELASFASSLEHGMTDEPIIKEFEAQGVKPLIPRVIVHSGYNLLCKEPVTSLDDVKGKITRTAGPNWVAEAEAVGFTTVSMPPLDQFEALQRGVIDCVMGPLRDWFSIDLLSVASELTMDDEAAFVGFPGAFIANPAWFDALPPGAQNIVWAGAFEWATTYGVTQANLDVSAMKKIAEDGTQTIRPMEKDLREALQDFQATERATQLKNVPPGQDADVLDESLTALGTSFHEWLDYLDEDPNFGGKVPAKWADFLEYAQTVDEIEAPEWKERVWVETFEPRLPAKP